MDRRPIGVFDSGIGGLTVLKKLTKSLPKEHIIYLGDTARVPYGNKSKETVTRFAFECVKFLKKFNIKLLAVACNTASSWSLDALQKKFPFPVIGVIEPAVKEACLVTRNSRIGVIGTKATVKSNSYIREIKKINKNIKIYQKACPLFVPLVEENWLKEKVTYHIALKYLDELKKKKIDTLILGCTHYPLLRDVIKAVFGRNVRIIDSSGASREVDLFLKKMNLKNKMNKKGRVKFYVTDDPESFRRISKIFLKKHITVKKVNLS